MTIQGVIFDMDGLMFDTERLAIQVWQEVGARAGHPIARELLDRMRGRNSRDCRAIFTAEFGETFPYERGRELFGEIREAYFQEHGVPVKPGLHELLRYLKENGYAVALATSTSEPSARALLRETQVDGYFDRLVFGNQVARGKPEPDIFLAAAEAIGAQPGDCAVLEDSEAGIQAAYRAGCRPVMVPDLSQPTPETAKLLFAQCDTLLDVIPLLERAARGA